jgi:hypothetical protein
MRKSRRLPIPLNGVDRTDPSLRSKFRSGYGRTASGRDGHRSYATRARKID